MFHQDTGGEIALGAVPTHTGMGERVGIEPNDWCKKIKTCPEFLKNLPNSPLENLVNKLNHIDQFHMTFKWKKILQVNMTCKFESKT